SGYRNEIHFSSHRQNTLFQILHVLRHLDPTLAQSLVDSHDQLAVAARRYPNGLETMSEEAEAEAKRRKADGATCGGGGCYVLEDDPVISTASADSLTLFVTGTLRGQSKTRLKSIGKTRRPLPATTRPRNTGHRRAYSVWFSTRPGSAWGLRPRSY